MISHVLAEVINGVAAGSATFLIAAGLTWIFGTLKILNMAHGHFFMVGAYIAFSLTGRQPGSLASYFGAAFAAGLGVAVLGYVADKTILRRLRNVDYHYVLIATFALMLLVEGVVRLIWGLDFTPVDPPPQLSEPVELAGVWVSSFTIFVIVLGVVVFAVLDYIIHYTWVGKVIQGIALDPYMARLLGLNVPMLLTVSVVASFALAGFAGGLLLPYQTLSIDLGSSYLLLAFFAVIIGGLGSVRGAFAASILLGLVQHLGTILLPDFPGLAIYVALAGFLILWPNGIFPGGVTR